MTQLLWWPTVAVLTLALGARPVRAEDDPPCPQQPTPIPAGCYDAPQACPGVCCPPTVCLPCIPPAPCYPQAVGYTEGPVSRHMRGDCRGMHAELHAVLAELGDNPSILRKARTLEVRDKHAKLIWRKDLCIPSHADVLYGNPRPEPYFEGGFRMAIYSCGPETINPPCPVNPPVMACPVPSIAVALPAPPPCLPVPPAVYTPVPVPPWRRPVPPIPPAVVEYRIAEQVSMAPVTQTVAVQPARPACCLRVVVEGGEASLVLDSGCGECLSGKELTWKSRGGATLKLGVTDDQVKVSGPFFEAKADSLGRMGPSERIVLRGRVWLRCNKDSLSALVKADEVVLDLATGSVEIRGGTSASASRGAAAPACITEPFVTPCRARTPCGR